MTAAGAQQWWGKRDPRLIVGAMILAIMVMVSVLAPVLPIGSATQIAAGPRLGAPSWVLPFGTDQLGRSNLPRVVSAIQATVLLSASAVLAVAVVGTFLGLAAAYWRGAFDQIVMRLIDIVFALPPLLLAVLVAAIFGPGPQSSAIAIFLISLPLFVRVVRSSAIGIAQRDFIALSRISGAGPLRIVFIHLLPNILGPLIVQFAYSLSVGMLIESTLSFLGLGVQPPAASLGSLLYTGSPFIAIAPWLVLAPGLVLTITVIAVNLLADGLRSDLEPLRRRVLG